MFYLRLRDEASINRLPGLRFIADRGPTSKCKIFLSLTDSAIVGLLTLSLLDKIFQRYLEKVKLLKYSYNNTPE